MKNIFNQINEAIGALKSKQESPKQIERTYGEGYSDVDTLASFYGASSQSTNSLNIFGKSRILNDETSKIQYYREMASMPEIADVIDDAVNESSQQDDDGKVLQFEITDEDLKNNDNASRNIEKAFDDLFFERLELNQNIDDWLTTYFEDGRVYLENVIDTGNTKKGIIRLKKLPTETMDVRFHPFTGKKDFFIQYKSGLKNGIMPATIDEALKEPDKYIVFYDNQITYIDTGKYGRTRNDIIGYLDKVKQSYNQLKLLEQSVVIYRLVRAPERFVFNIDVGQMPPKKAEEYVEKVKLNLQRRLTYDPSSGSINGEANVISMLDNFFLPKSSAGRGSSVETIGGNPSGFKEMDDIYFFQRKLYRALKYPLSRVTALQERQESQLIFSGTASGEITQDEIKWGRFLKKQQDRFTEAFTDLFLIHLDKIGYIKEYDINRHKFKITMTVPNNFIDSMWMKERQEKLNSFQTYAGFVDNGFFSKYYLMKKILEMSDDAILENVRGFVKDVELGLTKPEENEQIPGGMEGRMDLGGMTGNVGMENTPEGGTETGEEGVPPEGETANTQTPETQGNNTSNNAEVTPNTSPL